MTDDASVDDQAHSVVVFFLAAHGAPNAERPTHQDLDLEEVIQVAQHCFEFRGHGRHIAHPDLNVPLSRDPWRELFGLTGTIGESLVIAAGCEVEVEWHRRAQICRDLPRQMILGQRFFSIAEGQEIISVGHRLINVVVRALAVDDGLRARMAVCRGHLGRWARVHTPFSDSREAWLSLNGPNIRALDGVVSESRHPSLRQLVAVLSELQRSGAWQDLEERRGQDFHRWRLESSVVAGIDRESGFITPVPLRAGGFGRAYGGTAVPYTAADFLEDDEARVALAGLRATAGATRRAVQALERALEPLSRGYFVHSGGPVGLSFGTWDESSCLCCAVDPLEPTT